jgi:hypothetical protein
VCTEILYTFYICRITICHGPEVPITANQSCLRSNITLSVYRIQKHACFGG